MNLKEYIEKVGPEKIAKNLNLSVETIKSWKWGARHPSIPKAIELMLITDGLLSWEDIYESEIQQVILKIATKQAIEEKKKEITT